MHRGYLFPKWLNSDLILVPFHKQMLSSNTATFFNLLFCRLYFLYILKEISHPKTIKIFSYILDEMFNVAFYIYVINTTEIRLT